MTPRDSESVLDALEELEQRVDAAIAAAPVLTGEQFALRMLPLAMEMSNHLRALLAVARAAEAADPRKHVLTDSELQQRRRDLRKALVPFTALKTLVVGDES